MDWAMESRWQAARTRPAVYSSLPWSVCMMTHRHLL
jgi:hypothetical protein